MKFVILFWLVLFNLTSAPLFSQKSKNERKIKLPVYLLIENQNTNDSLGSEITKILLGANVKVIDQNEWKRLTSIMNRRMFKEVNELKSKGHDADITKIQKKLPDYYQVVSLKYFVDINTIPNNYSPIELNIMLFPLKSEAKQSKLSDEILKNKAKAEIARIIVDTILPDLK